ncbi:MAG: hypothetical protein HKN04_05380 [Rhodothermaceae bacterium]|nr:hypothetical protein [Rhodothermaceae bacterium]
MLRLLVLLVTLFFVGCDSSTVTMPPPPAGPGSTTIRYEVVPSPTFGSAVADSVAYTDSDGQTISLSTTQLPWIQSVPFENGREQLVRVTATRTAPANEVGLTARILVGGVLVLETPFPGVNDTAETTNEALAAYLFEGIPPSGN